MRAIVEEYGIVVLTREGSNAQQFIDKSPLLTELKVGFLHEQVDLMFLLLYVNALCVCVCVHACARVWCVCVCVYVCVCHHRTTST